MKENKNFKFLILSYKELCGLKLHKINRCGELDEELALQNYSKTQYDTFIKRCKNTLKEIKKRGYNPTSMLIIAKCVEDGQYYIIEGQGRRGAIIIGNENKEINIDEIPCMIFSNSLTYDEIGSEIITHNIQKPNVTWKTDDIASSQAKQVGGEVEEAYKYQLEYQERLQTTTKPYTARLMLFGANKASHIRNQPAPLTPEDYRKDHELFMNLYEYFLNNFGKEEWRKKYKSALRRQDLGIVYESFFNKLYGFTVSAKLDPYKYLPLINEELCKWGRTKATIEKYQSFLSIKPILKREFMDFPGLDIAIMKHYPSNVSFNFTDWRCGNIKSVA